MGADGRGSRSTEGRKPVNMQSGWEQAARKERERSEELERLVEKWTKLAFDEMDKTSRALVWAVAGWGAAAMIGVLWFIFLGVLHAKGNP